eukprot:CAMPEP_0184698680 /NCGR_PEP_ID=MMETSP0313-20130426/5209_1 /TAXON_ID=2792 /ORGANISM="Porphyridium aerugineum, Strain SAG 1380-2" /LENGTH=531 /DNA_ID=CAMNT_0027157651 /DNA_START=87 /DNA_END=1682 /DNA_ORIENTATION=-
MSGRGHDRSQSYEAYPEDYAPYGASVTVGDEEAFSGPGSFVRTPLMMSPRAEAGSRNSNGVEVLPQGAVPIGRANIPGNPSTTSKPLGAAGVTTTAATRSQTQPGQQGSSTNTESSVQRGAPSAGIPIAGAPQGTSSSVLDPARKLAADDPHKATDTSSILAQMLSPSSKRDSQKLYEKPRILMAGLPRSGKTSIQSVIFHKVSPHETLFLESTIKVVKDEVENSAFCQFQVWDVPGSFGSAADDASMDAVLNDCSALIFVIDVTSDHPDEALLRLHETIVRAYQANPAVFIEVFIHKADALTEEQKVQCQRELQDRVDQELQEVNLHLVVNQISYRATSIFDHSVYEAFSQVIQKLTPETGTLESLLDFLVNNCGMEKAFLFDVVSKLYVATDSTPVHPQDFELCSDMIEVIIDISCIYDNQLQDPARASGPASSDRRLPSEDDKDGANGSGQVAKLSNFGYRTNSTAIIRLSNNLVLYLREVSNYLALCCIIRNDVFDSALGLIEYNIGVFREGLSKVVQHRVRSSKQI